MRLRIVIAGWGLVLVRWGSAYAWGCHVAEIELDPATHQVRPLRLTAFVEILERPHSHGPYGAKGVGELPMDGPAPALVHALRAQGFDLRRIPATPERLLKLL